ncbi:hypothetical protein DFR70_103290 [Nocardia tenerifensis]|uniref:Uncharacterized protein n=1 Tax=Nocardia tenerifensis TaxID=228006 RepID=A0A318K3X0_9NOCA|nr:hypothetical protein [Nocardia tenerifensis]PXX66541.1 hypothetical protein DFR70_103290 [Nocardia tenerifensis]
MKNTLKAIASASVLAAAVSGIGVLSAGAAHASGMSYDQCLNEAASRQAAWEASQDPTATHATFAQYSCVPAGVDTSGNQLYEVTYTYKDI